MNLLVFQEKMACKKGMGFSLKTTLLDLRKHKSLYRNAFFLILNYVFTLGIGYIFWIIITRFYSQKTVGLFSVLISALAVVTKISLLGLDNSLIRYIDKKKSYKKLINSGILLSSVFSLTCSLFIIFLIRLFLPEHRSDIRIGVVLFFILGAVFTTISNLFNSVFIAGKKSIFLFIKDFSNGILKIIFVIIFLAFSLFGLMFSVASSSAISLLIAIFFYKYEFKISFDFDAVKSIIHYSAYMYVSSFFALTPLPVIQFLITKFLSPEKSAVFYISYMLSYPLFFIPDALAMSLFAEGSAREKIKDKLKSILKYSFLISLTGLFLLLIFGKIILSIFGAAYPKEGYLPMIILGFASLPFIIYISYCSIYKITDKKHEYLIVNIIYFVTSIISSVLLIKNGLVGISIAIVIGWASAVVYIIMESFYNGHKI
ncbi:oligosaccharide flippase family protein [Candidatus Woesearchaeota archaeon]|nr:oligosaccharide flippase family protein [Candidatus Woesearchaeota archaeon]